MFISSSRAPPLPLGHIDRLLTICGRKRLPVHISRALRSGLACQRGDRAQRLAGRQALRERAGARGRHRRHHAVFQQSKDLRGPAPPTEPSHDNQSRPAGPEKAAADAKDGPASGITAAAAAAPARADVPTGRDAV